jgi:hypothetical protein
MSKDLPKLIPLKYHPIQSAFWQSPYRFNVVPAGRRSGKTELSRRKLVKKALAGGPYPDWKGFAAAPVRDQAKRIYWDALKALVPVSLRAKPPSESHLIIYLINGSEIHIIGMDKPERIEGTPWDHGILDEYANMKSDVWTAHVRPALSDRRGTCDFIGVPEGRNHYYDLDQKAQASMAMGERIWGRYHWISADILPEDEIIQAKQDLDEMTYLQEYEGSFVIFAGLAYYNYNPSIHVSRCFQYYNPRDTLILTFDFNVSPGTASIIQELPFDRDGKPLPKGQTTTSVLGEVHIYKGSNTDRVCRRLINDWGKHEGPIECYGDVTGGAEGSAKIRGTDWDLIKKNLYRHFGSDRVSIKLKGHNPRERMRINSVNSRLMNMKKESRFQVDGDKAPNVIKDFEGVRIIEGSAGEIDKKTDKRITHLTDGIGYYIAYRYPVIKAGGAEGY